MKHETGIAFSNVKRRKALQHHANLTGLEASISTPSFSQTTSDVINSERVKYLQLITFKTN